MQNNVLPIAERFHSLQGEGRWAGTPMHFIRLAGCSVGKLVANDQFDPNELPILKTGAFAWRCHTYDGRGFWCDTDFNLKEKLSFDELLEDTYEGHICLTGGEPLIHWHKGLEAFVYEAAERDKQVHIETSGTIDLFDGGRCWVSVSPKLDCLDSMIQRANEIKLLVDEGFDSNILPLGLDRKQEVYLQPINNENSLNEVNVQLCLELLKKHPEWKLSLQLHKVLGLR